MYVFNREGICIMYQPRIKGHEIRTLRQSMGLSQLEFANLFGYSSYHIINYMENERKFPPYLMETIMLLVVAGKIKFSDVNISRKDAGYV